MLLTQNEIELLACFFPRLQNMTAKELELKSALSHETVFRLLNVLVKHMFLELKKVGKTNVFAFLKNDYTYQIFVYSVTKKRIAFKKKHMLLHNRLYEFLNEINPECAILFGSYAKGTETAKSDVDILLVTVNKHAEKIANAYRLKYSMTIHPVIVDSADFRNIKTDNIIFWNELVEYGILFDGIDYFFKEVYK